MKLILLRHGESEWNLLNQFTGWTDVGLTENGIQEAQFAAEKILQENILIKTIYTSILLRSTHTTEIIANVINFNKKDIQYDWRLNERHYGSLQGLNKSETAAKYGENQVQLWRRSYDIAPPLLSDDDKRHPRFNEKFRTIEKPWAHGDVLLSDFKRRLPNVLRDSKLPNNQKRINELIKWLEKYVIPLDNSMKHSGAVGLYVYSMKR